ncbi:MAG: hypothetical protein FJX72_03715 [Armatimonadetes bacterium]|nr:hypothetical protein [Armatimonadota bacterium]
MVRATYLTEAVMLARALIERAVTFAYLSVCPEDEWKRYIMYPRQKAYRKLDQQSRGAHPLTIRAGLADIAAVELDSLPEIREALTAFTGRAGKAKTRWTELGVEQMIGAIAEHTQSSGETMLLAYLTIYDDASEALHGTWYGCLLGADADRGVEADALYAACALCLIELAYVLSAVSIACEIAPPIRLDDARFVLATRVLARYALRFGGELRIERCLQSAISA